MHGRREDLRRAGVADQAAGAHYTVAHQRGQLHGLAVGGGQGGMDWVYQMNGCGEILASRLRTYYGLFPYHP